MNKWTRSLPGLALFLFPFTGLLGNDVFPSLSDSEPAVWHPGKIVWHDLFTAKPAEAATFYSAVFGWQAEHLTFGELEVLLMRSEGYPVAGIVERPRVEGETADGVWIGYVSCRSVDAAVRAITDAGGRLLVEKGMLPGRGMHAICADPQGAIVGLIRSESGDPGEYLPNPQEFVWSQQFSRDPDAAAAFYQTVSDFEIVRDDRFGDQPLYIMSSGDYARAGLSSMPEQREGGRADWIQFVRVESIQETLKLVEKASGKIAFAPREDLLDGRIAIIADPGGTLLGLLEVDPQRADTIDAKEVSR
jgi:predicted enzyme related to lactoylglutathione lyase